MRYAATEKYNPLTKQPKKIPVDLWDETAPLIIPTPEG